MAADLTIVCCSYCGCAQACDLTIVLFILWLCASIGTYNRVVHTVAVRKHRNIQSCCSYCGCAQASEHTIVLFILWLCVLRGPSATNRQKHMHTYTQVNVGKASDLTIVLFILYLCASIGSNNRIVAMRKHRNSQSCRRQEA